MLKDNDIKINELKDLFSKWKMQIDKIVNENNVDTLYTEHEFYEHLVALYNWVNNGNNFEDMFGTEEEQKDKDHLLITYDIIDDIIDAIKDCCYNFKQYENDNYFKNKKVMFIDSSYSLYKEEEYNKINMA